MKILFVYGLCENLGIEYLSALLQRAGHQTDLLYDPMLFDNSTTFTTNKHLGRAFSFREQQLDFVRRYDPDLVAFSVVGADYHWAMKFARQVRQVVRAPILFGGKHPTAVPDTVLALPYVDYVCVGEGDEAMVELVDALAAGRSVANLANIWSKEGGQVHRNPVRPLFTDLDSLPFPDKDMYYQWNPIWRLGYTAQGRRGCVNGCTYCHNNAMRRMYLPHNPSDRSYLRMRSVDSLLKELGERHRRYGFKLIRFVDDDFAVDEDWLSDFASRFQRECPGVKYKIFLNPMSVNERTVALLESSGCTHVQMGVQSVDPGIRRERLDRSYSNDRLIRSLDLLRASRLVVTNDLILGIPWQSDVEQRRILDFYLEHTVDFVGAYFLQFFPDTEITARALADGLLTAEDRRFIEDEPADRSIVFRNRHVPRAAERTQEAINNLNYLPGSVMRALERLGPGRDPAHATLGFSIRWLRSFAYWAWAMPETWDRFPHPAMSFELPGLQEFSVTKRHAWIRLKQMLRVEEPRLVPEPMTAPR